MTDLKQEIFFGYVKRFVYTLGSRYLYKEGGMVSQYTYKGGLGNRISTASSADTEAVSVYVLYR